MLTGGCDVDNQVLLGEFVRNLEASLDVSHLDGCSGHASIALPVVLINIDVVVDRVISFEVGLFKEFLRLNCVALVLNLAGKLFTDELFFLRSDRSGELKCSEPILEIHSHFEGKLGLGALQKYFLG